jgi:hypothetical protein
VRGVGLSTTAVVAEEAENVSPRRAAALRDVRGRQQPSRCASGLFGIGGPALHTYDDLVLLASLPQLYVRTYWAVREGSSTCRRLGFRFQSGATPQAVGGWAGATLQTLQEPILRLPWVCFRGGGQNLGSKPAGGVPGSASSRLMSSSLPSTYGLSVASPTVASPPCHHMHVSDQSGPTTRATRGARTHP